ncbi:MAG: SNF2-related protein [Eubacteriales bacterium]|nr:SNF2-related protein [Eubacteriales bacterium]
MTEFTVHQRRYFAEQLMLKRPQSSMDSLVSAMSGTKVDLNPHQVDAALFALKSPLSSGVLLADEVGLGKTIEAGLVLAQYWSERKRSLLLIVPASLRNQWRAELDDKFFIPSLILESSNFNRLRKSGVINPFSQNNFIVICSYNFAASKASELAGIDWDLVVIDEAHRLRNVYKSRNVTATRLKEALSGKRKLLLTATPLQNNLMELYGLVSIIDDRVFGDANTYRDMYLRVDNEEIRNIYLKKRLLPICKRTLRKQVREYVPYTSRTAILEEYTPTKDEELLYNQVSDYLRSPTLFALPRGQRTLITMILRKLLASSSFAISGTLDALVTRLEKILEGIDAELHLEDYDTFEELLDESELSIDEVQAELIQDRVAAQAELQQLREFAQLAKSITINAKGENLLTALKKGFDETEARGGLRKAVVFTESRRTQEYLLNLLSDNGYEGQIVFLNGSNSDAISKKIYSEWKERHANDGFISGSRQADMKAAIVEEFRTRACILIGTEAAAEGINLQFCSLLVNYDMPWNPQRIEQRIGRCHRYGQKCDVVVVNFVNNANEADRRVYELLDQKFRLFSGLFGSSDEVLGTIESGVDFEKRIAEIYQNCKTTEEIKAAFDQMQADLQERINERMSATRQAILENFDDDVTVLLRDCKKDTLAGLGRFQRWLCQFFIIAGASRVKPLDQYRFEYSDGRSSVVYNLSWENAEQQGDTFLRRDDELCQKWLSAALAASLPAGQIRFDYTHSPIKISFLEDHVGLSGWLIIDKLIYEGYEQEEHLVITVHSDDGTVVDEDIIDRMMELPAVFIENATYSGELDEQRKHNTAMIQAEIEKNNKRYFLQECEKLDAWSDDLKEGLQREIKELEREIREKTREFHASTDLPLATMLEMKEEINRLKKVKDRKRREINLREDEIEAANERLQEEIRAKLAGSATTVNVMAVRFEIK